MIKLEGVHFRYPQRDIFSGLNLALEKSEVLGLIGPNSSGKTTLLKLMDGLLHAQEGRILLEGKDLRDLPRLAVARTVAVVPQGMEVPFSFTVGEIVLMGRAIYLPRFAWEKKKDWAVAREAMALTNVLELEARLFTELSQGEKQRVLIARALAQEPKVILLDEPTSHLDINHQVEIHELIRHLNVERNLTVLHISHDLNMAAEYCHRLALLHKGAVYFSGPPSAVLTEENIRKVYETTVLIEKNPISGAPRVTPLAKARGPKPLHPVTVHLICGGGSGADLARRLVLRGCRVTLGVLNLGDTDQKVGATLGLSMVLEEPFAAISERAFREHQGLLEKADLIVVERFYVGRGNLANLRAALEALKRGKKVIVLENELPLDMTDGQAGQWYQQLQEGGALFVPDHSYILKEVEKV
jgi:iron complex transport system ATP-binding protein